MQARAAGSSGAGRGCWERCQLQLPPLDCAAVLKDTSFPLPLPLPSHKKTLAVVSCCLSSYTQEHLLLVAKQLPSMRVSTLLTLGCAAVLSRADVLDDIEDAGAEASSSVASVVESVTSSAVEKPTFTVNIYLIRHYTRMAS